MAWMEIRPRRAVPNRRSGNDRFKYSVHTQRGGGCLRCMFPPAMIDLLKWRPGDQLLLRFDETERLAAITRAEPGTRGYVLCNENAKRDHLPPRYMVRFAAGIQTCLLFGGVGETVHPDNVTIRTDGVMFAIPAKPTKQLFGESEEQS